MTNNTQQKRIEAICRYIEDHMDESLTLAHLATQFDWSPSHLQKVFKSTLGITPKAYQEACRLNFLKNNLQQQTPIADAVFEAGYGSLSRVYEKSNAQLGMSPKKYQKRAQGLSMTYTTVQTWLGTLLLAATDVGLCAVYLGDDEQTLKQALVDEFPKATHIETTPYPNSLLAIWLDALTQHLEGHVLPTDLPLDIRGTAFQKRVWAYLQTIPSGIQQTYKDIAIALDQPTAYRAVARACATNKLALVIPCHRVIRSNGTLAGYRWGLERKQKLLTREKKQNPFGTQLDLLDVEGD